MIPQAIVHFLILGSLIFTSIGALVLITLVVKDFLERKIW